MHDFLDNLANHQHQKMLREISNDEITPKKSDKLKQELYEIDEFDEYDDNTKILAENVNK